MSNLPLKPSRVSREDAVGTARAITGKTRLPPSWTTLPKLDDPRGSAFSLPPIKTATTATPMVLPPLRNAASKSTTLADGRVSWGATTYDPHTRLVAVSGHSGAVGTIHNMSPEGAYRIARQVQSTSKGGSKPPCARRGRAKKCGARCKDGHVCRNPTGSCPHHGRRR
jgi:hypothetical protein